MRGTRRQGRHAPAHARSARARDAAEPGAVLVADGRDPDVHDEGRDPRELGGARFVEDFQKVEDVEGAPARRPAPEPPGPRSGRAILRAVVPRDRTLTEGGAVLRVLVLASTPEDTTVVDLASGSLLRLRIPWPEGHAPDLSTFDIVEAKLADDPECDDLAKPEAATAAAPPRRVGSLQGRRVRAMLGRLSAVHDGPLLGFHGQSAPYWDFHGLRPSIALVHPTRGPQLLRRRTDDSTWVRFGWERDDVWLPVEDARAVRALAASRSDRLTGKPLATALGHAPHYVLVTLSSPRGGHCYKICPAILPKG